jgi:repressor LexA
MSNPTQSKAYEFIRSYIRSYGYSPTLTEIASGIAVRSKGLISRYVHALAEADLIELVPGTHRSIRLKPIAEPKIPLLGRIAAGLPIEAISDHDAIDVVTLLTESQQGKSFGLVVKGDSMVDEGIFDGDIVLCEKRETALAGEIVVALIDQQEATLKRFYKQKDGTISLVPANIALKPQVYEAHRVQIQGVFRGLIRLSR